MPKHCRTTFSCGDFWLQVAAQSQQPKELLQARDALEQADFFLELDDKADIFDPIRARFGLDREFAKAREHQQARKFDGGILAGGKT